MGFAGYAFALRTLTVTPRLDLCQGAFENEALQATTREVGGELRVAHAWDLPGVTLEVGLGVGASWFRQSFTTRGEAAPRDSAAFRGNVGPGASVELGAGFYLLADVAAETYLLSVYETTSRTSRIAPVVTARTHLGLGKNW
jgi:hypothetical protein